MSEEIPDQPAVDTGQKKKPGVGITPFVAIVGVVSVALLWSMSAGDPYWRLAEGHGNPSIAYDRADDLRAVLTTVSFEAGNADAAALNPSVDQSIGTHRATDPVPSDRAEEFDLAVARAVMSPAPPVLSPSGDRYDDGLEIAAPASVREFYEVPDASPQPRIVASADTEAALALNRAARAGVQRRLALAGFNPSGIDGVFGPRTRAAITDFQTARGFPATGYLEPAVYAELKQRTERAYQAFKRQAAAAPSASSDIATAPEEPQIVSADDKGGCARDADGRIIERQSFACDITGLGETLRGAGRIASDSGDDGIIETSAGRGTATMER